MKSSVILILVLIVSTASFQLQRMHHRRATVLVSLSQGDSQSEVFPQVLKKMIEENQIETLKCSKSWNPFDKLRLYHLRNFGSYLTELHDEAMIEESQYNNIIKMRSNIEDVRLEMEVIVENEQLTDDERKLKEAEYLIDGEECEALDSKGYTYDMRTVSEKKRLAIRTERYNINKIHINNKSIRFKNETKETQLIRAIDTMMRINKEKERICIEEMKLLLDGKDSRFSVITGAEKKKFDIVQLRYKLDRERSSLEYGLSCTQMNRLNYEEEVYNNEIKTIQFMLPGDDQHIPFSISRKDFYDPTQPYIFLTNISEVVRFDEFRSDKLYFSDYKFIPRWLY